jgi:hypothetical protein
MFGCMLVCGEGIVFPSQNNQLWFCLIVLNERWHTHISNAPPYGCRVGGKRWVDLR